MLALQHARDNREIYGRYADKELVWEVVSAEETEDYYEVRLSYRPARRFRGRPGVEQFTIDKAGPIELRRVVNEPRPSDARSFLVVVIVAIVAVGAAVGTLFAVGEFRLADSENGVGVIASSPSEPITSVPFPTIAPVPGSIPTVTSNPSFVPIPSETNSPAGEAAERHNDGLTLIEAGRLDEAIIAFTDAIRLNPKKAEFYYNRGQACGNLNMLETAVDDFNEAIRLDPQYAVSYRARGKACGFLGQNDIALLDLDEALRLDPNDIEAIIVRGAVYVDLGLTDQAMQDFNSAIEIDPEDGNAYHTRGRL